MTAGKVGQGQNAHSALHKTRTPLCKVRSAASIQRDLAQLTQTKPKPGGWRCQHDCMLYGNDPARGGAWQRYVGMQPRVEMMAVSHMPDETTIVVLGAHLTLSGEEAQRVGSCTPWLRHVTDKDPHCDSSDVIAAPKDGCTVVFRAPNVHGLPLDGTLKLQYMRGEAKGEFAIVKVAHILGIRIPRPNCHPAPLPAIQELQPEMASLNIQDVPVGVTANSVS